MTEETFQSVGEGIELALPGDTIRNRHIATRASVKRQIVVLVAGDSEFEGYAIGLDAYSLQLLEIPSGEVSSISLDHIVAISDGVHFDDLSAEEKETVDRRTASFRKASQAWLLKNWPSVYGRHSDEHKTAVRRTYGRPPIVGDGSPDGGR